MADANETAKKTIDQAAAAAKAQSEKVQTQAETTQAAGAKAFRDGVERSVVELNAQGKKNLEALVEATTAAQRGAEVLGQQVMAYSKKSWEDGVTAAQSIAQARSVQEAIELQTNFAKSAMETYIAEMTRMTETFTTSMKDSLQPLNARVSAQVETFQAAR